MRRLPLLCLLAAVLGLPRPSQAGLLQVPQQFALLQAALDSCASGDTILVAPGEYHGNFVVPDKTITLGSQTLLTGDTLFIPQTILDGDSLGTVLTVRTGSTHRFVMDGFILRNGYGREWVSAGIQFADSTDAELRNLYFGPMYDAPPPYSAGGLAIYGSLLNADSNYGIKSIVMDGFRFLDSNSHNDYMTTLIFVTTRADITVRNMIFNHMQSQLLRLDSYAGSIDLENITVQDGVFRGGAISAGNAFSSADCHHQVRNINFIRNQFRYSLLAHGGSSPSNIENLSFIDNVQLEPRTTISKPYGFSQSIHSMRARNLVFRGNRGLRANAAVGEIYAHAPVGQTIDYSEIDGLVVENCVLGDSSYTQWNGYYIPTMLTVQNVSIKNARFASNTTILTPGEDTAENGGVWNARLLNVVNSLADSILFKNISFTDNLVIDRDNYDEIPNAGASMGRCLHMETGSMHAFRTFLVDSVSFIRNRQPNMTPEWPRGDVFALSNGTIGSVLRLTTGSSEIFGNPVKVLRNLLFLDNDDGGIQATGGFYDLEGRIALENVQMLHMSRQALDLHAKSFTLDNVLIDGCTPYRPLAQRSEQMPLRLICAEPSTVRNCTVVNCTTPYVLMAGLTFEDEVREPRITFENCLFANNPSNRFEALVGPYGWPGWDYFRPGRYTNCLLPEAMPYGEQNLVGVAPQFDAALGPPYLDPGSPCVDAGSPAFASQDLEDPAHPGFPLWPSLGSLRNDIGFTGGPHATLRDTTWSALPKWEPHVLPGDFSLGPPWPNPFNPVTQIPFALRRTVPIHLAIHNLLGQEVAVLVDRVLPVGTHRVTWKPLQSANGVYIVTLKSGSQAESRSITLLK
jgi:hypothetical protein